MIQNGNIYIAEEGNFIVRISDEFIMGEDIDLGTNDSIDNYREQPYTEESYNAFYESIGSNKRFKQEESSLKKFNLLSTNEEPIVSEIYQRFKELRENIEKGFEFLQEDQ